MGSKNAKFTVRSAMSILLTCLCFSLMGVQVLLDIVTPHTPTPLSNTADIRHIVETANHSASSTVRAKLSSLTPTLTITSVPISSSQTAIPTFTSRFISPQPTPTTKVLPVFPVQPTVQQYPAGASAVCNDGTLSYSKRRRGTCSSHGGVLIWLKDLPP